MMLNGKIITLTSRLGVILLMLGIGVSVAGLMAYLADASGANKGTMIGGLVLAALGHLLVTTRAVMHDEF